MGSGLVRELFMRGRHSHISTALSTQRMRSCDYMVRLQFTCLAQFRVGSLKDWSVVLEEFTADIDPDTLQAMHDLATGDEYGFVFMNLKDITFRSFKSQLKPASVSP